MKIPEKYIPKVLTKRDKKKQKGYLNKSRKMYKEGKYYIRPKVKSFKSKSSKHLEKVKEIYDIEPLQVNKELIKKTQCDKEGLNKILNKGRGAYYSSGSRPNQTAESWGKARMYSYIMGGPTRKVDHHITEKYNVKFKV